MGQFQMLTENKFKIDWSWNFNMYQLDMYLTQMLIMGWGQKTNGKSPGFENNKIGEIVRVADCKNIFCSSLEILNENSEMFCVKRKSFFRDKCWMKERSTGAYHI